MCTHQAMHVRASCKCAAAHILWLFASPTPADIQQAAALYFFLSLSLQKKTEETFFFPLRGIVHGLCIRTYFSWAGMCPLGTPTPLLPTPLRARTALVLTAEKIIITYPSPSPFFLQMDIPEKISNMIDAELAHQHAVATERVARLQDVRASQSTDHRELDAWIDTVLADTLDTIDTMSALQALAASAFEPGSAYMCEFCEDKFNKATCPRKCISPAAPDHHFTPVESPSTPPNTMRAIRLAEMMKPAPKLVRRHLTAHGPKRPDELGPLWHPSDDRLLEVYAVHFAADANAWQQVVQNEAKVDKIRLNQLRRRNRRKPSPAENDQVLIAKYGEQLACDPKVWTPVKKKALKELKKSDFERLRGLRRKHRSSETSARARRLRVFKSSKGASIV